MGSVNIAVATGDTVNVSISRVAGTKAVAAYSDAAFTTPITLPAAIRQSTRFYLEDDAYLVTPTIGGIDAGSRVVNLYGDKHVGLTASLDGYDIGSVAEGAAFSFGYPATGDPMLASHFQNVGTANRTHFLRAFGSGLVSKIRTAVNVQSGNICASIYTNTGTGVNALPLTRIATTGSIACPAAGGAVDLTLDTPVNVTSGDYWFSICADNITATFATHQTTGGVISPNGRTALQDSTLTGPATAAPTAAAQRMFVLLGV